MCSNEESNEIVERLSALEERVEESNGTLGDIAKSVELIETFILGDMKGNPGWAERIRTIERWVERRTKFEWMVIAVIIGQFILFVLKQFEII